MAVVSVRVSDEVVDLFHRFGIKPGTFCRQEMEDEAARLRLESARSHLEKISVRPQESAVDQLREDRRGH